MGKSLKKLLTLVIAAGMTTTVLTGCSSSDDSGDGESTSEISEANEVGAMADYKVGTTFKATEPIDFTMLFQDNPNYALKDDWMVLSEITKRTNVKLDMTIVPFADYSQKRSVLVSSGEAPMIMSKTYPGEEVPFISSGAILPISDYIDYMPNFKSEMEDWGAADDVDTLRQADGKFYVLPGIHENPWTDYSICYRKDIFDKLGLEEPKTGRFI